MKNDDMIGGFWEEVVRCKYCGKIFGAILISYLDGREDYDRRILERSKKEHETNWCPKRFDKPLFMTENEKTIEMFKKYSKQKITYENNRDEKTTKNRKY
jgi:hypothetical protein